MFDGAMTITVEDFDAEAVVGAFAVLQLTSVNICL